MIVCVRRSQYIWILHSIVVIHVELYWKQSRPELIIHKIPPIILFEYSQYLSLLFSPHYTIIQVTR